MNVAEGYNKFNTYKLKRQYDEFSVIKVKQYGVFLLEMSEAFRFEAMNRHFLLDFNILSDKAIIHQNS